MCQCNVICIDSCRKIFCWFWVIYFVKWDLIFDKRRKKFSNSFCQLTNGLKFYWIAFKRSKTKEKLFRTACIGCKKALKFFRIIYHGWKMEGKFFWIAFVGLQMLSCVQIFKGCLLRSSTVFIEKHVVSKFGYEDIVRRGGSFYKLSYLQISFHLEKTFSINTRLFQRFCIFVWLYFYKNGALLELLHLCDVINFGWIPTQENLWIEEYTNFLLTSFYLRF